MINAILVVVQVILIITAILYSFKLLVSLFGLFGMMFVKKYFNKEQKEFINEATTRLVVFEIVLMAITWAITIWVWSFNTPLKEFFN